MGKDTQQVVLADISTKGVATLTLNRPEIHNAFDDRMIKCLLDLLRACEKNAEVRVVILQSKGKHFSAGADLNWMKSMAAMSYQENVADAEQLAELLETLYVFSKPLIAKVQGAAYAGAIGLIACCDIVIAETDAFFCISEVKIGLVPAVISPYVIKAISARNAHRYFLTAEKFNAQQAQNMGLIHELVEKDCLDVRSQEIAELLLQNAPVAIKTAKELMHKISELQNHSQQCRKYTTELIAKIRVSDEGQEGLSAFLDKRSPSWLKD